MNTNGPGFEPYHIGSGPQKKIHHTIFSYSSDNHNLYYTEFYTSDIGNEKYVEVNKARLAPSYKYLFRLFLLARRVKKRRT